MSQPKFGALTPEERLAFYQNDYMPWEKLDGLDRKFNMDFNIDWWVIRPAIIRSIKEIRSGRHTYHSAKAR